MAYLATEKRKELFTLLGLGKYNKTNIKKFQKLYFTRKEDIDGIWGINTDNLGRHVMNVVKNTTNFKPEEFRCGCGAKYCTGYPTYMKVNELKHIQTIRTKYKKSMEITSGLRCKTYNSTLKGSDPNSNHLKGRAVDFYMKGVTDTLENRKKAIKYIKGLKNHNYTYGDGINSLGKAISAPGMGNAMHTDTK